MRYLYDCRCFSGSPLIYIYWSCPLYLRQHTNALFYWYTLELIHLTQIRIEVHNFGQKTISSQIQNVTWNVSTHIKLPFCERSLFICVCLRQIQYCKDPNSIYICVSINHYQRTIFYPSQK
jgi:hypothetical protein